MARRFFWDWPFNCIRLIREAMKQRSVQGLLAFLRDRRVFESSGGVVTEFYPILNEFCSPAGIAGGHYFHQDLLVSQFVFLGAPRRHIDVGSRIDGFVAHVAAFRLIEVLDIRAMPQSEHPNIRFIQANLSCLEPALQSCSDSVSCLHVLEHLGLGRYGDAVDPAGHLKGLEALVWMVEPGGRLYVSSPIGRSRVCFNAHRVFDPLDFPRWLGATMRLERFDFVDDDGVLHVCRDPSQVPVMDYGCGIYTFRKLSLDSDEGPRC